LSQTKDKVEDDNTITDTPRSFPDGTDSIYDDDTESALDATTDATPEDFTTPKAGAESEVTTDASLSFDADDSGDEADEITATESAGAEAITDSTKEDMEVATTIAVEDNSATEVTEATELKNDEATTLSDEKSETTTTVPKLSTTVTIVSIEESEDTTIVVTTARPDVMDGDATEMTTVAGMDGGLHEFDCEEMGENEMEVEEGQIPLNCMQMDGQERRRVTIVINKSQVDPSLFFAKNVKVVVKDFMVMDINGASVVR